MVQTIFVLRSMPAMSFIRLPRADGNLPVASSYTGHEGRRWRAEHHSMMKDDLKLPDPAGAWQYACESWLLNPLGPAGGPPPPGQVGTDLFSDP